MKIRIYHNPRCSKSRQTLALLKEAGTNPEIIEYLESPPDAATIKGWLGKMGYAPRALIRQGEEIYRQLGLDDENKSDEALIAAMAAHPILIERPVVVTDKGVRLCRPPEKIYEIL